MPRRNKQLSRYRQRGRGPMMDLFKRHAAKFAWKAAKALMAHVRAKNKRDAQSAYHQRHGMSWRNGMGRKRRYRRRKKCCRSCRRYR